MREKIQITSAEFVEGKLELTSEQPVFAAELMPKNHVLVDSDGASFIYIAENKENYTYIALPEGIWDELKRTMETKNPVMLKAEDTSLELKGIHEELAYLIDNIQGNLNYGEEFVSKVERVFLKG
jgi:hypothetical protein